MAIPVQIGSLKFDGFVGVPPKLPEASVSLHSRPGVGGIGARVQPAVGQETEITVQRIVALASWGATQYSYRALIGTVVTLSINGGSWATSYSVNYLILGVEIVESRQVIKAVGVDPDGTAYDLSPAVVIVSRWRMVAVPSS